MSFGSTPGLTRRGLLQLGALGAAHALLPAACTRTERARAIPQNIVLLVTDDQSWDSIGYASGGRMSTPHLDRLAASGTTLEEAYCNSMPCIPSRASMTTGLHHHRWPRDARELGLLPGAWTWAHALRAAGYATMLVGKMHYTPRYAPHGFEQMALCEHWPGSFKDKNILRLDGWRRSLAADGIYESVKGTYGSRAPFSSRPWAYQPGQHRISWVRDRAIEYLDQAREAYGPFAITVSFSAPHSPYDPLAEFAEIYDPQDIEVPTDQWGDMDDMPAEVRGLPSVFRRESLPTRRLQRVLAAYRALISQVDAAIGEIARHIDPKNTLVLYCSDHGDYLGKRGQLLKDPGVPFDDVARVPMFAYGAGIPAGRRLAEPASLVDLAPTILRAAGIDPPGHLDGVAIQDRVAGTSTPDDRPIYCFGRAGFNMVRVGGLKYFRAHQGTTEMLFDLDVDPGERRNLARDPALAEARGMLAARFDAVNSRAPADGPKFEAHPVQVV